MQFYRESVRWHWQPQSVRAGRSGTAPFADLARAKALHYRRQRGTGERRAVDRDSGIELVDAVIASIAFFDWPPNHFGGHYYIDGGFHFIDNADLSPDKKASADSRTPRWRFYSLFSLPPDLAVETLQRGGSWVEVVHSDEAPVAAFASVGTPSSPMVCDPAARAGGSKPRHVDEGASSGLAVEKRQRPQQGCFNGLASHYDLIGGKRSGGRSVLKLRMQTSVYR